MLIIKNENIMQKEINYKLINTDMNVYFGAKTKLKTQT